MLQCILSKYLSIYLYIYPYPKFLFIKETLLFFCLLECDFQTVESLSDFMGSAPARLSCSLQCSDSPTTEKWMCSLRKHLFPDIEIIVFFPVFWKIFKKNYLSTMFRNYFKNELNYSLKKSVYKKDMYTQLE